jgi:ABC-type polysaccharide/polyol phosphate transport system ATPase subunit
MSDIVVSMEHVSKKFKKGELFDSLRDLIPALTGRLFNSQKNKTLEVREFWAIDDVSFDVKKGEAFGIIGPNGAGKSTILKLLSGIIKPTSGVLQISGRLSALIEVGAGFHGDLTGRENIFLNGVILGMKKNDIRAKFDEIVEFSGLSEFIDTPVKRYSTGMYARLGFSVAAHVDPDILIVDEVLSVGDFSFQRKCIERMRSVIHSGATVIFVSHNLRAVAELCGRSLLLDHGKIVISGSTNDVIRSYLGRFAERKRVLSEKTVFISSVKIRDQKKECVSFMSGQKAWIEIETTARKRCEKLAVVIFIRDASDYPLFHTSTERLGYGTFSLEAGQTLRHTFELQLHLATGTFHVGSRIYRYDIEKEYDYLCPAATIIINSDDDVQGAVNVYPKLIT